jgi:hypothetical protein
MPIPDNKRICSMCNGDIGDEDDKAKSAIDEARGYERKKVLIFSDTYVNSDLVTKSDFIKQKELYEKAYEQKEKECDNYKAATQVNHNEYLKLEKELETSRQICKSLNEKIMQLTKAVIFSKV